MAILLYSCSDEQGNGTTTIRELTGGSDGSGYTLTVSSTNGTVTKSPNKASYNAGDSVTLIAVPTNGYKFSGWSGGITVTNATTTVFIDSNLNITANFRSLATPTYLLTINATNGTVTKSPEKAAYDSGDAVILTAHPNNGYNFAAWSGDTTGTNTTISIMMNSDKTINAAFQLLNIPVITAATSGDGSVTLSWNSVAGATSYNIYYSAGSTVDKTGTKIAGGTSPKTITGLTNGTQYAFAVSAMFAGGESGLSTIKAVTPFMPIPVIASAISGAGSVTLSWNSVSGATSYNIYYAIGSTVDKTGTKITGATSPKTLTGLTNGTQYAFSVSAVFAGGESGLSTIQTSTTALITPAITTVTPGNGSITISWNSVPGATSYNIYYATGSTVDKTGTKITGTTSPKTIIGLTNGTQYAFAVSAVFSGGESGLSAIQTTTTTLIVPTIMAIASGDGYVSIVWNSVANSISYNIYYTAGTLVDKSGTKISDAISPKTITGLTNGTQYAFAVSTLFTGGESGLSAILTATPQSTSLTDFDGNVYHTVTIGTQKWMVENLKTTKFNDGSVIPLVSDPLVWGTLATPGYCWSNNDSISNKNTYGALYNWYAVSTEKIAPFGWHVPTDSEWSVLVAFVGGDAVAGESLKETGTAQWLPPNTGATNSSGFSALPGGYRGSNGSFYFMGYYGYWWSATAYGATNSWYRFIYYDNTDMFRANNSNQFGFSIRCIRNP